MRYDVPAGSMLMLLYGSGNGDQDRFAQADRFDPSRPNARRHLSFGHGTHVCVGAPFARAERRIGMEAVLRRLDDIVLDDTVTVAPPQPGLHPAADRSAAPRFRPVTSRRPPLSESESRP